MANWLAPGNPTLPGHVHHRTAVHPRLTREGDGTGRCRTPPGAEDTESSGAIARGVSPSLCGPPPTLASPTHLLARSSVIPSVLETALDSDLPGLVRAWVSEDVYGSLTGTHVLIPRGAQLFGTYGENTRGGQPQFLVAWTNLKMSDGTPINLGEFSAFGADGAVVLFDLAGNATAILTGGNTSSPSNSDLATLLAGATGNATSRVAACYMGDLIDRGPRFRLKAGTIMNVLVEENL